MASRFSYLKALGNWLLEARPAWVAVVVIVVAVVVALIATSEAVIRLTGLVLQMFGLATVVCGISKTRRLFEHPSLASKTRSWLGRFPTLRGRPIELSGSLTMDMDAKGRFRVRGSPGPNPTIESRLESLERNVVLIDEEISSAEKKNENEFSKIYGALKDEEEARKSDDGELRKLLEVTETGGLHISEIGATWILVGVVLGTAAPEIAQLSQLLR